MLKNKKVLFGIISFIIVLATVLIIFNINKNNINDNSINNDEHVYSCSYNNNDGYKTTIYRYEILVDKYSFVKNVSDFTILDYKKDELYKEAKNFYSNDSSELEEEFDDENKDIIIKNYIDYKIYSGLTYNEYIEKIDEKYICDKLNLDVIVYECSKNTEEENYSVQTVYTVTSDKNMNVGKVTVKEWSKYKSLDMYNRDKDLYKDKGNINVSDKDKIITNTYDMPVFDKDGKELLYNIKDYVDSFDQSYICKIKSNSN